MDTVLPNHLTPDMPLSALAGLLLPHAEILSLDHIEHSSQTLRLYLHTTATTGDCPRCQHPSQRVHSHYQRRIADMNWGDRAVSLHLTVRRFRCANPQCMQRVFAERVPQIAPLAARRTTRLQQHHLHVARSLGGAAGARMSMRNHIATSRQTLLRALRRQTPPPTPAPRIIGLDDWAQGTR